MTILLSPHFSLEEMARSARAAKLGIPNNPTPSQIDAGRMLCVRVLEQILAALPDLQVNSGFRSDALNAATPGSSSTSKHIWGPRGAAADIESPSVSNLDLGKWIEDAARRCDLDFDVLIYEHIKARDPRAGWIHIEYRDPSAARNRRSVRTINK